MFLILFLPIVSYAESEQNETIDDLIKIGYHENTKNIIFDGDWTFTQEWKPASENKISFEDGNKLSVKTAHDGNNIFVVIDFISDTSADRISDKGIVCIDSKYDQSSSMQKDDFCFISLMNSNKSITLQGGTDYSSIGNLQKISNHPDLITVGGLTGKFDRYSTVPHTIYEFKIPIEVFGRSDVYGFFAGAFDSKTGHLYGWPQNVIKEEYPFIPQPNQFGTIISPDKSIPEFNLSTLLFFLVPLIITFTVITKFNLFKTNIFNH